MLYRRIFVSCGQETDEEISLGRDIITTIGNHKGMEGFLAQDVYSPEDLNRAVFEAMKTCDALFAVMHKRGGVTYRNYPVIHRSSVWIQQEIAILCYRRYLQGSHVPIRVYAERGILLEGVMKTSIVNPIIFEKREQLLKGLNAWLNGPEFDEDPILARRDSLFQRRVQNLREHHWLILELIAAHSSGSEDHADYGEIGSDFLEIFREQKKSDQEIQNLYESGRQSLSEKGLTIPSYDAVSGKTLVCIPQKWWNLVLQELRNQGRVV